MSHLLLAPDGLWQDTLEQVLSSLGSVATIYPNQALPKDEAVQHCLVHHSQLQRGDIDQVTARYVWQIGGERGALPGANYLAEPLKLATLPALLEQAEQDSLCFATLKLQPKARLLQGPDTHSALTEIETAILAALFTSAPDPVSREALVQQCLSYDETIATRTLETHLYRVRQKVAEISADQVGIVTERIGYCLRLCEKDATVES